MEEIPDEPLDLTTSKMTFSRNREENIGNIMEEIEESPSTSTLNIVELSENQHQMGPTNEPLVEKSNKKINKQKLKIDLRQKGEAYMRLNGTIHEKIEFKFVTCKCSYSCMDLDFNTRRKIFENFWKLGSWDAQTTFLVTSIKRVMLFSLVPFI